MKDEEYIDEYMDEEYIDEYMDEVEEDLKELMSGEDREDILSAYYLMSHKDQSKLDEISSDII